MQPFSIKTLELLIIAAISFLIVYFSFSEKDGLLFMILRSGLFCILFCVPTYLLNISPDVKQVVAALKKRILSQH